MLFLQTIFILLVGLFSLLVWFLASSASEKSVGRISRLLLTRILLQTSKSYKIVLGEISSGAESVAEILTPFSISSNSSFESFQDKVHLLLKLSGFECVKVFSLFCTFMYSQVRPITFHTVKLISNQSLVLVSRPDGSFLSYARDISGNLIYYYKKETFLGEGLISTADRYSGESIEIPHFLGSNSTWFSNITGAPSQNFPGVAENSNLSDISWKILETVSSSVISAEKKVSLSPPGNGTSREIITVSVSIPTFHLCDVMEEALSQIPSGSGLLLLTTNVLQWNMKQLSCFRWFLLFISFHFVFLSFQNGTLISPSGSCPGQNVELLASRHQELLDLTSEGGLFDGNFWESEVQSTIHWKGDVFLVQSFRFSVKNLQLVNVHSTFTPFLHFEIILVLVGH